MGGKVPPLKAHVQIDEYDVSMEIDMGASVMSESTHKKYLVNKRVRCV